MSGEHQSGNLKSTPLIRLYSSDMVSACMQGRKTDRLFAINAKQRGYSPSTQADGLAATDLEWGLAGDHGKEHNAHGPDIGRGAMVFDSRH